jgi:tripartite-type tricarboxylate transporter receptor subunit TctC
MTPSRREALRRLALAAAGSAMAGSALAQSPSSRPIRIVVPFAPGGATDIYARLLAHAISAPLGGRSVIVENVPGGAGVVGLEKVARADKDGSTLLLTTSTPISAVPHLMKKLPFKVEDFVPVALIGRFPLHVFTHPSVPAKDFRELVAYVKANPGKLSYAFSGIGSLPHLVTEMVKGAIGLDMVGVSYKGAGPAVNDLVAGHVQVYMDVPSPALEFALNGRLKVLAVMGDKRSALIPDVPSMAEIGYPNLGGYYNRYSLMAPAGTPATTIESLHKAALQAMESGPLRERQESDGASPGVVSPEQLGALMKEDHEKWGSVIRRLGITLD